MSGSHIEQLPSLSFPFYRSSGRLVLLKSTAGEGRLGLSEAVLVAAAGIETFGKNFAATACTACFTLIRFHHLVSTFSVSSPSRSLTIRLFEDAFFLHPLETLIHRLRWPLSCISLRLCQNYHSPPLTPLIARPAPHARCPTHHSYLLSSQPL